MPKRYLIAIILFGLSAVLNGLYSAHDLDLLVIISIVFAAAGLVLFATELVYQLKSKKP